MESVNAAPECPFCGAGETERVGQWGGQMITAQWRCVACGSYFEAIRDDFGTTRRGGDDVLRLATDMRESDDTRR